MAQGSISTWSIGSPCRCYSRGKRLLVPACRCPSPLRAHRSHCRPRAASSPRGRIGSWGPSSHPPVATHPSILFPNMATSFSFNHPQNCSWDFRNASFHRVCPIMLPGRVAGLRESCNALVMGEWARCTLRGIPGGQGLGATGAQTERAGANGGSQDRYQLEHRRVSHLAHPLCAGTPILNPPPQTGQ